MRFPFSDNSYSRTTNQRAGVRAYGFWILDFGFWIACLSLRKTGVRALYSLSFRERAGVRAYGFWILDFRFWIAGLSIRKKTGSTAFCWLRMRAFASLLLSVSPSLPRSPRHAHADRQQQQPPRAQRHLHRQRIEIPIPPAAVLPLAAQIRRLADFDIVPLQVDAFHVVPGQRHGHPPQPPLGEAIAKHDRPALARARQRSAQEDIISQPRTTPLEVIAGIHAEQCHPQHHHQLRSR